MTSFIKSFVRGHIPFLVQRGEYEITLADALSFSERTVQTQFLKISCWVMKMIWFYEDGMRFVSVRYFVKDRTKVLHRLGKAQRRNHRNI